MKNDYRTQSLKDVLRRIAPLKALAASSARLTLAQRWLKSTLPSVLSDYCQISKVSDTEIVIEAYSQAVATHLRFSLPKLQERLKKWDDLAQIDQISIKVKTLPQAPKKSETHVIKAVISEENRQLLLETASSIQSPELRASLEKLAQDLRKKSTKK